ncbi:MAG: hypothetical protein WA880_09130, partial [Ornithinimicrobium sp.]
MSGRAAMEHEPGISRSEHVERLRPWWPEIAVATIVAVLAVPTLITLSDPPSGGLIDLVGIGCVGASAICFRRAPGWALALVWAALAVRAITLVVLLGGAVTPLD